MPDPLQGIPHTDDAPAPGPARRIVWSGEEDDRTRQLRWLLILRVAATSSVLAVTLYIQFLAGADLSLQPLFWVVFLAYAFSLVVAVGHHAGLTRWTWFAGGQLAVDVVLETLLLYFMGGMQSPFVFLYLMTVGAAGVILSRRGAFATAALTVVCYGLVGLMSYPALAEWMPVDATFQSGYISGLVDSTEISLRLLALALASFGVAWLSSELTGRLRQTGFQLRASREELEALQRLNQRIIQGMSGGLLAADSDGLVVTLNGAAEEITGRRASAIAGHPVWEVFGLGRDMFDRLRQRLEERRMVRTERTIHDAAGVAKAIGMTVTRIDDAPDAGGRDDHVFVFMFRDLTEIKRLERELRMRERMSVLGEMAGSIAHEIRNPLASISGSLQLLRRGNLRPDAPDAAELMDIVVRESQRLSRTIEDFLEFARPARFEPRDTDLRALAEETLTLLRNSDEVADQRLRLDVRGAGFVATVDAAQIKQVFWNLARNAVEAMPSGGELIVHVARAGGDIEICFEDTGSGMAAEQIEDFFQPYVSGKEKGTGLGLSVVYKILERHQVPIEVDSEPGRGTRIMLTFQPSSPHDDGGVPGKPAGEGEVDVVGTMPEPGAGEPAGDAVAE